MGCYESRHAELSDDEEDPEENTLYFKSVFEEREARLGSDHPRTLAGASDLGLALKAMGDYEEAMLLMKRALEGRESVLGASHPETVSSVWNLAQLQLKLNNDEEARVLVQRAATEWEDQLGPGHPHTQKARQQLQRLQVWTPPPKRAPFVKKEQYGMYTHADGTPERVKIVKTHSDSEGGGFTIWISYPSD